MSLIYLASILFAWFVVLPAITVVASLALSARHARRRECGRAAPRGYARDSVEGALLRSVSR